MNQMTLPIDVAPHELPNALRAGLVDPLDLLNRPHDLPASLVDCLIIAEAFYRMANGWDGARSYLIGEGAKRAMYEQSYSLGGWAKRNSYWMREGVQVGSTHLGYKAVRGKIVGVAIRRPYRRSDGTVADFCTRHSRRRVPLLGSQLAGMLELWSLCGERTPLLLAEGNLPIEIPEGCLL